CQDGALFAEAAVASDPWETFAPWRDALAAGEMVCISDVAAEPDLAADLSAGSDLSSRSDLSAPAQRPSTLVVEGGTLAILDVGAEPLSIGIALAWPEPLAVGPRRAHWVRRAGAAAGSAIERIRLVESIAALRTQVRVLVDAGATLAREGDLHGALEGI